jgi:hypothetical protein
MFRALEPFSKDVVVDEPGKDSTTAVKKFFGCLQKYQHKEPLKDRRRIFGRWWQRIHGIWFWKVACYKTSMYKIVVEQQEITRVAWNLLQVLFRKQFWIVKPLI